MSSESGCSERDLFLLSLAAIGVKPADIGTIALSHVHPDHAGNVDEFPGATLVIQKAEWDYAMSLPQKPFSADRKVEHGRVIHVLDLLKRAGVAKIAFAVSPTDKGGTTVDTQPGK